MNDRTIATEKRKLREAMLAKRRGLPHAAMLRASESVARHFADHPILAFAASYAGYIAMRGELDVRPVFAQMERFSKQTALPRLAADKSMEFHAWKPGDRLERHELGMEEPLATAPVIIPEIILVPLIAFDGDGYRLGYGGGYYDRTIAALRQLPNPPQFIGVAYSMQEVDQLPAEQHDAALDGILTELGVSMFR